MVGKPQGVIMKLDLGIKEVKIIQEDENGKAYRVWEFGTPEVNAIIEKDIADGAKAFHLTVDSSAQWTDLVKAINESIVSMEKARGDERMKVTFL